MTITTDHSTTRASLRDSLPHAGVPAAADTGNVDGDIKAGIDGDGVSVLIISGSVGAGHDGASRELAERLERAGAVPVVRDFLDALPSAARHLLRDAYGPVVGRAPAVFDGLFRGLESGGRLWEAEQRLCALAGATLAAWVEQVQPDVIVSTYPLASQSLGQMTDTGRLSVPFFTYLTDPAAHASWIHPAAAAHLTVTAATAQQCTTEYGVAAQVAGPLVPLRFAASPGLERLVELREELGLPLGRPVALIVAGSLGMGDVLPSVKDVADAGWVPLVLCGRNAGLHKRVSAVSGAVALGWRTDVHDLMQVADVLVHNAGGLSFTESLVAGLPAVTYRSIPGHGHANASVLHRAGLAPWPVSASALTRALEAQRRAGRGARTFPDAAAVVLSLVPTRAGGLLAA